MLKSLTKDPLRKRLAITSVITIVAGQIISFVVVLSSVNCISGDNLANAVSAYSHDAYEQYGQLPRLMNVPLKLRSW